MPRFITSSEYPGGQLIHDRSSGGPEDDLLSSVDVAEVVDQPGEDLLSTAAVLRYCKFRILRPYTRLLATMGLRPLTFEPTESRCLSILGHLHLVQALVFMCMGYLLQRDRGFCYKAKPTFALSAADVVKSHEKVCYGSLMFSYVLPSLLHMAGYVYALWLFRIRQNEQLQNLMERAFLLSSGPNNAPSSQRHLVRILWLFIGLSIVWVSLSLVAVSVMMLDGTVIFQWLEQSIIKYYSSYNININLTINSKGYLFGSTFALKIALKLLLLLSTLWHDMVQATITASYCLQSQLLTSHLHFLRKKLLQHSLQPLAFMREINEFQNLLEYLNEELAPAVCIFTVVNLSWASAGLMWIFNYDFVDKDTHPIIVVSVLNVVLWILASIAPFIQAARLTSACEKTKRLGHDIRVRPFVYLDTPSEDLDAVLLFTSSLHMQAKLFQVPISKRYLCLLLAGAGITILTLGQCHVFQ
ncbi:Adenine phosphoribosyltransferase [Frankliniella fusca]|uniref:Adenine phosphoribosyltransferase n=1 Tax=Frankliniella fusca TaxID=407009 RepID=A0AAE1LBK7_9NEOP|nr:Adenine phosphoribosyltransferase [Frankliniella fusca]